MKTKLFEYLVNSLDYDGKLDKDLIEFIEDGDIEVYSTIEENLDNDQIWIATLLEVNFYVNEEEFKVLIEEKYTYHDEDQLNQAFASSDPAWVVDCHMRGDQVMYNEAFNNWKDGLCKDGEISETLYNECCAWELSLAITKI